MAIPAYLWLKKDGGAELKGSVTVKDRVGSIEIKEIEHTIYVPTDNHTGKITGPRVHTPFIFFKEIDASSVYLYKALTTGQKLQSAEVKWYQFGEDGGEGEYFNVTMEGVTVAKITSKMYDIKDPTKEKHNHLERVELRYEKITWNFKDGNLLHDDSWDGRTSA
ncbi:type VI secretion system tube protein TssD [Enterobacteriaceae bacterium LUAb1]